MSSRPSSSTKACSASRWSNSSRTATITARPTSSSTSATRRCSASSTFRASGLQPGVESIGSVQHIAISVPRDRWEELRRRLDEAGVTYFGPDQGIARVDVLQGPGRHPDRAAQRPADVLRRPPARRVAADLAARSFLDRERLADMSEWNAMTYEGKDTILRRRAHRGRAHVRDGRPAGGLERADVLRRAGRPATSSRTSSTPPRATSGPSTPPAAPARSRTRTASR